MDGARFDALIRSLTHRPSRRVALRLLAGGLLGALMPDVVRAAQRPDRDGDQLFDDDETNVYGTNPDVWDTDGDGSFDGEEVYLGTDPLIPAGGAGPDADPNLPAGSCAGQGLADCGGVCVDLASDDANCGGCGVACQELQYCAGAACLWIDFGGASAVDDCGGCPVGHVCGAGGACLVEANPGLDECTYQGLANCGGICIDVSGDDDTNCGACGRVCPPDFYCYRGNCLDSLCRDPGYALCADDICANLATDPAHCGACFNFCGGRHICVDGGCLP